MSEKKEDLNSQLSHSRPYSTAGQPALPHSPETSALEKTKDELEDLKKKILKKVPSALVFSVLPAPAFKLFEEDEGLLPEEIAKKPLHCMLVIPEDEYKNVPTKIKPDVVSIVKESKQNVWIHIKTPVDVWNYGLDSKFDFLDAIAASFPLHDKGFLGALRVANIHKTLVLRKFEKYVATYAVGGSLVRGTADKDSDVDTFVVIDDTDVKKMPRLQLLERLKSYIYDYIREATALAGVKNILNVQVYLLTDFWQSVKDAQPVIFTFIRDGVPMHDRGTFLPWKLLLKMGKIKPSPESVDQFMKEGERTDSFVKRRLLDAMIDVYWGIVTPTQALMMLAGSPPPVPKTIVAEVKKLLVDTEKLMGMSELKILEKVVTYYKDYEHGKLKEISGAEIDVLLKEAKEYDTKIKQLRQKLEKRMTEHTADNLVKEVFDLLKTVLGDKSKDALVKDFERVLVKEGKISGRFSSVVKEIAQLKDKSRSKGFTQEQLETVRRDTFDLINRLTEYAQRKEFVNVERGVLQVMYGDKKEKRGELVLSQKHTFFVEAGKIKRITERGFADSTPAELEASLRESEDKTHLSLSASVLSALKKELGDFSVSI